MLGIEAPYKGQKQKEGPGMTFWRRSVKLEKAGSRPYTFEELARGEVTSGIKAPYLFYVGLYNKNLPNMIGLYNKTLPKMNGLYHKNLPKMMVLVVTITRTYPKRWFW